MIPRQPALRLHLVTIVQHCTSCPSVASSAPSLSTRNICGSGFPVHCRPLFFGALPTIVVTFLQRTHAQPLTASKGGRKLDLQPPGAVPQAAYSCCSCSAQFRHSTGTCIIHGQELVALTFPRLPYVCVCTSACEDSYAPATHEQRQLLFPPSALPDAVGAQARYDGSSCRLPASCRTTSTKPNSTLLKKLTHRARWQTPVTAFPRNVQ